MTLVLVAAISAFIALVAVSTRSKPQQPETSVNYFLKMMVISFVSIYGGMTFFGKASSGPEIDLGEPDF